MTGSALLVAVEAHLLSVLGRDSGRAGVDFVGAERIDVLRFGPDPGGLVHYATVGMSATPMSGGSALATEGPRAELVLTLRGRRDRVLRRLAALAASPAVEGLVLAPGAGVDLGEPLWDGARFAAVLVGEPGGLVPDLDGVRFLPLLPMTPNEAAYKRVHGPAALQELWRSQRLDPRDPDRAGVDLADRQPR